MMPQDRILAQLPATAAQLCARLTLSQATICKWTTRMIADGEIHVREKLPGKRRPHRVFAAGPGDAPRLVGGAYLNDPLMAGLFGRRLTP